MQSDGFSSGDFLSREIAAVGGIIDLTISGRAVASLPVQARGLIDTGSSVVFIDRRLALQAGLKAVDLLPVDVPGGLTIEATVYAGYLEVPVLRYREQMRFFAAAHRQASHDVLLGRSFLKNFVVTFDGPAGTFHFYRPFAFPGPLPDDDYAT